MTMPNIFNTHQIIAGAVLGGNVWKRLSFSFFDMGTQFSFYETLNGNERFHLKIGKKVND